MKKALLVILALFIITLSISTSYAEVDYHDFPNYDEMMESRILIGHNYEGNEVFEFPDQNPIYDNSGYTGLFSPDEVLDELYERNVKFDYTAYTSVSKRSFLIIVLKDGEKYALELLTTKNGEQYVLENSFRLFCLYYFGFSYNYSGK